MTNREWLRSLNDEELGRVLSECANFCVNGNKECVYEDLVCHEAIAEWLKKKHNNKQHIYVN